ncbi:CD276 antigen-like isoform X4 [Conger conger]|uniref:CD276 antigen-like isoform X4 n=1 Tax=Conger conger TaxID=82655 RepID=UPI002A5A5167|nr:CD276 antigen-like isoform X4 [Conger conger]
MMRIMRSLIFALHLLIPIPAAEISVPVVAAPGSDITLSCSFPRSETDLLFNLIVFWEHGNELVHSYYKATDHLEEQSPAYRGRSQLSPDQLAVGDASLRLTGVRASDHGKYTCNVANEQGRSKKQIFLTVAAAYEEPELTIQTTCDSIILTFLSTLGFPEPAVLWRTETGSDITNRSNTTMVLKGGGKHYEVVSEMVLKQSDPHTVTFEMRLELLNQSFSRSVSLHPLPDCCGTPVEQRDRLFLLVPLLVVLACLVIAVFWCKSSLLHGPGKVDIPVGAELVAEEEEEESRRKCILIPAAEISVPVVAAPGSDIILSCSFPLSETDLLFNLIVVWEHGDEVVHSYYKAPGHLEEQSPAYRGRTQLSPDQLAVGDASLRLTGVRASDHGKYTCDVTNEQGRKIWKQIFLVVAAAYDEPELAIQTTCDSVILTFLSTLGFPEPTVLWRTETGSDITNQSNTSMVLKGGGEHYEVIAKERQWDPGTDCLCLYRY